MSTEREGFHLAILAEPHDPATYLVFADWLDDHDEPREAGFYRAAGAFLQTHRRLPGRTAHWLPAGQEFPDHIYADDERFTVARYHGSLDGPSLVVLDLNDITGGRGLVRRHRGFQSVAVLVVSRGADPLPRGVDWDRLRGDVLEGKEFVDTFQERVKVFTTYAALLHAMSEAFQNIEPPPTA